MRLETLEATDFRSIREASLKFVRVNWILGHNAEGKTTTLRAIDAALMARASKHVVNAEARSAKVKLSVVANKKTVNLEMTRFRSKVNTPVVNGRALPRTQYIAAMNDLLGITAPVLDAVLSSGKFMDLDASKQASLVLAAAGVTHEWDDAETAFADWCEDQKIAPFKLTEVLSPVRLSGLALVDEIYDTAYKLRTAAKKEAALESQPAPEPHTDVLQYVGNPGLLKGLKKEAAELSDRIPKLQQKLSMLRDLSSINAGEDPRTELERINMDELRGMAADLRSRRAAVQEADGVVVAATAARDAAKKMRDSLAKERCPFGVKCDFKNWAPDEWSVLEANLASLEEDLANASKARAELVPVSTAEIKALQEEKARIESLERKVEVRAKILERIGGGVDAAAVQLEAEQASGRKSAVSRLLDLIRSHERAVTNFEGVTRRRSLVEQRVSRLDSIVKGFDKPIRFKMVGGVMDGFVGPMREALTLFFGADFEFKATATGGFNLEVMKNGIPLPFKELSKSEQLMVSTAAQHAIAVLAGAKILIIDAADTMRGSALQRFIRGLYRLSKGYETIVVASTTGRITPEASPLRNRDSFPDTQIVIVENGTLRALPQLSPKELKALQ